MKITDISPNELTNVMRQYYDIKIEHMDKIVLFQLGDFYEMFFEDAQEISKSLELTLTGKNAGLKEKIPMCGVPQNSLNDYLKKMMKLSYNVVVVEQYESSSLGKKLIERRIAKIISPGTYLETVNIDNNFIGSLNYNNQFELAYGDVATGELFSLNIENIEYIKSEIINQNIKEIIVNSSVPKDLILSLIKFNIKIKNLDDLKLEENFKKIKETKKYNTEAELNLLAYLDYTQVGKIEQFQYFSNIQVEQFMFLPPTTQIQLELVKNQENKIKNTLFEYMNNTKTAMGRRLLIKQILHPLIKEKSILDRQNLVEKFYINPINLEEVRNSLEQIYDFERLLGKIINNSITPKEIENLKNSLQLLPQLYSELKEIITSNDELNLEEYDFFEDLIDKLNKVIIEDAPNTTKDGGFIKKGYDKQIDELRMLKNNSNIWLAEFEAKEAKKTGIKNLKVKYNKIFGYFIEVTNSYLKNVPENYVRKQTMAGCERYITEELKYEENKILNASELLQNLEIEKYNELKEYLKTYIYRLQKMALLISKIDVYSTHAYNALNNNLVKPTFNNEHIIEITNARHPIVEKTVENYIDNDLEMIDNDIIIITGPNMAGKSTYMRMLGLIAIMAQMGAFVPVKAANLKIFDSIFTRIGASDNLSQGKSTFMVEMTETNEALANATSDSLLIFDELGRGTSTYDGISLAKAILMKIAQQIKCKTLFSTHYHELINLKEEKNVENIKIVHVKALDEEEGLVFYHKVLEGGSTKSYGIQVAKLAGIEEDLIKEAEKYFVELENQADKPVRNIENKKEDIILEKPNDEIENLLDYINKIDMNSITPLEAFSLLNEIKEKNAKI